jgi:hypothetical protein
VKQILFRTYNGVIEHISTKTASTVSQNLSWPLICESYQDPTVCFTDLDKGRKMIIFESILTSFIESVIFRGPWGSTKNWLKLKIEPP